MQRGVFRQEWVACLRNICVGNYDPIIIRNVRFGDMGERGSRLVLYLQALVVHPYAAVLI